MDEGVDVAIRIGELPDSSMQAVRVGQVRRVICASPAYLAQHGTPQSLDDLQDHVVVAAGDMARAPEWRLLEDGANRIVKVHPRMTTTTNDSAIAAAVGGFGLARLLSYQVAAEVRDGRLDIVLAGFEPPAMPVQVVHREGRHASRKVRAFLDLAIERLRADPALR